MYFLRYDGNVLDFTKEGPATGKVLQLVDNCFIRERKDRIAIFRLDILMACPGIFRPERYLEYSLKINKEVTKLTCEHCYFALLGDKSLCNINSFLLPKHFHHRKTNFNSVITLFKNYNYLKLPVPEPATWSYMNFRY